TVFTPFDDQRRAATLALLVRRLLHPLHVLHVLLGVAEVFLELLIEAAQGVGPLLFSFFDVVQLFFQLGGVLVFEDVGEIRDQQVRHHHPDLRRDELAADFLHVLALLNGADDRRVGRWTPDAALFQLLHQRRLVIAWRLR